MGQRLNIEIVTNEKTLANSYFHWSGYTGSAIKLTEKILEKYQEMIEEPPVRVGDETIYRVLSPTELAVRLLEHVGAGLNDRERENIKNYPEFADLTIQDCVDRNTGLLSVTPEGIKETEDWEEERVTINIEEETVIFTVFWIESKEEFFEFNDQEAYDALQINDYNPDTEVSFEGFHTITDLYNNTLSGWGYRLPNGDVVCWIE